MWICPTCNREFKNTNQIHSCKLLKVEDFFENRPPILWDTYQKLLEVVGTFGAFRVEILHRNVIFLKTISNFLWVKRKKKHLEICFFLDHVEDVPPVVKFKQFSKNRIIHVVPIDEPSDIDNQLIEWMQASYLLILG